MLGTEVGNTLGVELANWFGKAVGGVDMLGDALILGGELGEWLSDGLAVVLGVVLGTKLGE